MIQIYILLSLIRGICVDSFSLSQHPRQQFHGSKSWLFVSQRTDDIITTSTIAPTSEDPNTPYSQHNNRTAAIAVNDIIWKIRPCENQTRSQMFHWYICGIIDTVRGLLRPTPPPLLPSTATRRRLSFLLLRGRRRHNDDPVVVTATMHRHGVIGRFGIVTEPGPIVPPPLSEAIQRIYGSNQSSSDDDDIRAGAIVYMYVEPEYRGNDVGSVALGQVLPAIQRSCSCTYTLLVANDKTPPALREIRNDAYGCHDSRDRKLVQWYQRHGYHVADELQDMLGSPDGIYGIAMITSLLLPPPPPQKEEEDPQQIHPYRPTIQWW